MGKTLTSSPCTDFTVGNFRQKRCLSTSRLVAKMVPLYSAVVLSAPPYIHHDGVAPQAVQVAGLNTF